MSPYSESMPLKHQNTETTPAAPKCLAMMSASMPKVSAFLGFSNWFKLV